MYEFLEGLFATIIRYGILAVETVGVVILMVTAVKALISVFNSRQASKRIMAEGTTTALSFLLAGEVMKTIIAPDWDDVGMTCAVLLMRAAMAVLIQWESKHEVKED